jgi:hypothetical protein
MNIMSNIRKLIGMRSKSVMPVEKPFFVSLDLVGLSSIGDRVEIVLEDSWVFINLHVYENDKMAYRVIRAREYSIESAIAEIYRQLQID